MKRIRCFQQVKISSTWRSMFWPLDSGRLRIRILASFLRKFSAGNSFSRTFTTQSSRVENWSGSQILALRIWEVFSMAGKRSSSAHQIKCAFWCCLTRRISIHMKSCRSWRRYWKKRFMMRFLHLLSWKFYSKNRTTRNTRMSTTLLSTMIFRIKITSLRFRSKPSCFSHIQGRR